MALDPQVKSLMRQRMRDFMTKEIQAEKDNVNAGVTGEIPGAPKPAPVEEILSSFPSPEQVLRDPNSGAISRGLAGATLGLTHDVQEQAAKPITDPSRWFSPLTTPITAAITGLSTSGLVSPRNIEQGLKSVEALTPLMGGMDPFAQAAASSARTLSRLTIPGKIDKYLKVRGVRPPSVELPTPITNPARMLTTTIPEGGPVPEPTVLGEGRVFEAGPPGQIDPLAESVRQQLDKVAPELQPQYKELYGKLSKTHDPQRAAEMLFGTEVNKPLAPPKLQSPLNATQLLADRQLPLGQSIIVERPRWTQVRTTVKSASPAADKVAADMVTSEPVVTAKGTIDYGPIYDPATMSVEKKRLNTVWDRTLRYLDNLREKLPADPSIVRQAPNSWVLADLEKWHQESAVFMKDLLEQPWAKVIHGMDEKLIKDAEYKAVQIWKGGGKTPASYKLAIDSFPQELKDYVTWRESRFALEDAARIKLGLSELDHTSGPYIARLTDKDFSDIYRLRKTGTSLATDVQQTVGKFQRARVYDTMHEGEMAGTHYVPVNHAILMREYEGMKLVETARLMDNFAAHRVIHPDRASAMAASPTNKAYEITGLPGTATQRWFASTKAEALMVEQNLSKAEGLGLGRTNHWLNLLFRNLNLLNPLPHFTKNMMYKYSIAGGKVGFGFRKVHADIRELIFETNPALVAEFKKVMPYNQFGETAQTLMAQALKDGTLEGTISKWLGTLNRPSSQALFGYLDPALRYSLWKQKMAEGVTRNGVWSRMSPLEAANHVHVDLVRYGTRSDWVDFWKSIPLNFFVPWRVGSVTSVTKQFINHPIKTPLKIGFLDYIREVIYRNTGQYFHMPIDYVTGPIVQSITAGQDKGPGTGLATALGLGVTSRLLGPGGAWGAGQLAQALSTVSAKSPVEWDRVLNLWWGLSQLYTVPKAGYDAITKATPEAIATDLIKIAGSIGIGSHEAYTYDPHRVGKFLPEWLPGLQKSAKFKQAEQIREVLKQKSAKSETRRDARDAAFGKGSVNRALKAAGVVE